MRFANDHRLLRTFQLACLAAALAAAGCKGPDASSFSCTSSRECPSDYHCDLGTATTAGSLKCASGAPVAKTLVADATKFLLVKQPSADGTVRTTISAGPGAIASTPDFLGVRVVASQGTGDLASSPAQSDGSAAVFQLPQAVTQVSLRVQDDSGHTVAVTGYPERVVMSFEGKNVAGNSNPIAAYDAATGTDSLYDPVAWINAGLAELPASSPITNNIVTPAAYNGLSSIDGISSVTAAPPQPTATGPIGWERITNAPTATDPGLTPSPRTDMAVAPLGISTGGTSYQFVAYGGLDAAGALADPGTAPTIWAFSGNPGAPFSGVGWATVPTVTSNSAPGPFPSNFAGFGLASTSQLATISRSGAALAPGGSFNCISGACNGINYNMNLVVAGGTKPDGTRTSNIFAYGSRTIGGNIYLGWWDATAEGTNLGTPNPKLLVANAGMSSATFFNIPVPSGTTQNFFSGSVMVGGQGIGPANNDTAACQYLTAFSGGANPSFQVSSCTTTTEWAVAAPVGQIGFRVGAAITPTDNSAEGATVYLFGGARSGGPVGTTPVLQNDLWKGTISVVCNIGPPATPPCTAAGAAAVTQITWTLVPTAGTAPTSKPSPRAGAAIAFADSRKLVVYGGTDATGVQSDIWELDVSAASPPIAGYPWRRTSLEPTPALAPVARSKAVMLGPLTYMTAAATFLFGGISGTTPTNEVWALSKQGPPRLLIKAPTGISSRPAVTNASMSITAAGTLVVPGRFTPQMPNLLYAWDGSAWQLLGLAGVTGNIYASPQNALSYVQPDGNVYLMLMSRFRSTTGFASTSAIQLDGLVVTLNFQ